MNFILSTREQIPIILDEETSDDKNWIIQFNEIQESVISNREMINENLLIKNIVSLVSQFSNSKSLFLIGQLTKYQTIFNL